MRKFTIEIVRLHFMVIVFLLVSCNRIDTIEKFTAWFENPENGFVSEKYLDNIFFRVQLRPYELMSVRELSGTKILEKNSYDSISKTYEGSVYFILEIGFDERTGPSTNKDIVLKDVHSYEEYTQRILNLSFNLNERAFLITNSDTIYPSIYHYERGYELAKKEAITFAFPYSDQPDLTFVFIDDIFNTGVNKFYFDGLNKIPPVNNLLNPTNYEASKKT